MAQYIRLLGESVRAMVGRCVGRPPAAAAANPSAAHRCFSSKDDCRPPKDDCRPPKDDCQGPKNKTPDCPSGKEHTCAVKDANRHKRAKPDPCPPRHLNPAIPPWCTLPHLKNVGKKKIKVEKDPCDEGEKKCPYDEGIAYRRFKRAEERNFKETMQKRIAVDKKLDKEWKKAKKRFKKPPMKDTFTCAEKPEEFPPKCGNN